MVQSDKGLHECCLHRWPLGLEGWREEAILDTEQLVVERDSLSLQQRKHKATAHG